MVINTCSTATDIDKKHNLVSYTDATCDENLETSEYLSQIVIFTKILDASSQPAYFDRYGEMKPVFTHR